MALELYWASGDPYSWRVMLALEYKRLPYISHLLDLSRQEHKSPQLLKSNFRGKLPVLKDDEYVAFESLAVLFYLDQKYPRPPLFGGSAQEAGVIMRVICEYQAYAEPQLVKVVKAVLSNELAGHMDEMTQSIYLIGGEARTIEARLSKSDWIVGEGMSAADIMIYPFIRLLLRVLQRKEAAELSARFLPMESNYPALARWMARVESMPGYERTYPPHWRNS